MFSRKLTRFVAAGAAAIAVTVGGSTGYHASSNTRNPSAASAAPAAHAAPGMGPRTNPAPGAANGPVPTAVYGQVPQAWHAGSGTVVTGASAGKAQAAELAKVQGGT